MIHKCFRLAVLVLSVFSSGMVFSADNAVVIFHESGFPAADSAAALDSLLQALPGARFASADELKNRLTSASLLVLPYGSAFPEPAWPEIQSLLRNQRTVRLMPPLIRRAKRFHLEHPQP